MRNGAAEIELTLAPSGGSGAKPPSFEVFRLSPSGHRIAEVPSAYDPATGALRFTARTDYDPSAATLYYEITR